MYKLSMEKLLVMIEKIGVRMRKRFSLLFFYWFQNVHVQIERENE